MYKINIDLTRCLREKAISYGSNFKFTSDAHNYNMFIVCSLP